MKLIAVVNRVRLKSVRIVPCKGEGEGENGMVSLVAAYTGSCASGIKVLSSAPQ